MCHDDNLSRVCGVNENISEHLLSTLPLCLREMEVCALMAWSRDLEFLEYHFVYHTCVHVFYAFHESWIIDYGIFFVRCIPTLVT